MTPNDTWGGGGFLQPYPPPYVSLKFFWEQAPVRVFAVAVMLPYLSTQQRDHCV